MSFEEALARLCQADWSGEDHDSKADKSPKTSVDIDQETKPRSGSI